MAIAPRLSDELADGRNLTMLVQLRWLAVAGQVATIAIATLFLDIKLPLVPMGLVLAGLIAMNLVSRTRFRHWRWAAAAEMVVDVLALTTQLGKMIGTQQVTCEKTDTDRYGRSIATCKAGDVSINTWMVRNGWAVAYRQYGGEIYGANEDAARNDRAGIWASSFDMPWDWRKAH
ncbi:thermonuclease family protein [Falsirhodobacter sp. alg1]|uniref:thermonuclease family protein n=1 Tax=Falsirhodobacter sp. alg1 TaxID=1472418 RepID=UPI00069352A9|nr:thermonuclease family protein [Falsirhodobacter sp. alg1]